MPDPTLTLLTFCQRLLPIAGLWVVVRWPGPWRLVGLAVFAAALTTASTWWSRRVVGALRQELLSGVAQALGRPAAIGLRGGAHDQLLSMIWRGIDARERLASRVRPSILASALAAPLVLSLAADLEGTKLVWATLFAFGAAVAVRAPLVRRHHRALERVNEGYQRLARDIGHGVRAVDELQAQGLVEAFGDRLSADAASLRGAVRGADRVGTLATFAPTFVAAVVLAAARPAALGAPLEHARFLGVVACLGALALALARGLVERGRERVVAGPLDRLLALEAPTARATAPTSPATDEPVALFPVELRAVTFEHAPPLDLGGAERRTDVLPSARPVLSDVTIRWTGRSPLVLVGENGSGKSTLLGLLLGVLDPTVGSASLGGVDARAIRADDRRTLLGFVPQRPLLLEGMTVLEAIRLVAPTCSEADASAALQKVRLEARLAARGHDPLATPCATLSTGEAQRVAIARALVRRPKLLVLDEPEASIDAAGRKELRAILAELAAGGVAIVLATQHLDVAPELHTKLELPLAPGCRLELP